MKTRFLSAALAAMLIPVAATAQVLVGNAMTFPAAGYVPGLAQARFETGKTDKTSDILSSSTLTYAAGPIMANTTGSATDWNGTSWSWGDNTVFGYVGEMWVEAGTTYTFGKSVDDWAYVVVNGRMLIDNESYKSFITGTYAATTTGWVPIEIRIGNGDGGAGISQGAKWGIAYNTTGDTSWEHFKTGAEGWTALLDSGNGSLLRFARRIRVVSHVRENDPTILDVRFIVYGEEGETARVRALAFEDGERSFWKVVRPETFVNDPDGNPTSQNIGDAIPVNTELALSWKVSSDWATDLAKVKFEILTSDMGQLPLDLITIPATAKTPELTVSYNPQTSADVFNALLWHYADHANDLTVTDGNLYCGNDLLSNRTEPANMVLAVNYVFGKMGWEGLNGPILDFARSATRKDSLAFNTSTQQGYMRSGLSGNLYIGENAYCVIDVSGGPNAASYPVTYLDSAPIAGWGDEYKTTKILLRRIEPGEVKMGGKKPVTLTKAFYIGVFEMTQKQYQLVTDSNPSEYKGEMRPVEFVSWNDIRGDSSSYDWPNSADVLSSSFMGRLRTKTGLDFDLPTESQWEYACRAGTTSYYNNGGNSDNDLKHLGRITGNRSDGRGGYSEHTTVGSYAPNAWGLYDMHGNVFEWCLDWYDGINSDPVIDWSGASSGSRRALRGGYWEYHDYKASYRNSCSPSSRWLNIGGIGFRLSWTLP